MARQDMLSDNIVAEVAGTGADALLELGLMYSTGRDVELDLVTAHKWFNLSALRGNAEARRYRAELTSEMSKADVTKAQRLAREWMTRH